MDLVPVITGVGLVTPLGRSPAQTWAALLDGRTIVDHARVEPEHRSDVPRVSRLAIEAATEAVAQAGWSHPDSTIWPPRHGSLAEAAGVRPGLRQTDSPAVIVCTSKGPVEEWTRPAAMSDNRAAGRSAFGMAAVADAVAGHLGFVAGPRLTLAAACAGGLHGVIRAALLIRKGEARRVLVVAAEASVLPLFLASFRRLGVLPPVGERCRPFDVNRRGFLMSEAAAAVCIEARGVHEISRDPPPLAVVDRYAFGGDATHLTGSDPDGATLRRLISQVAAGGGFDLVHAHGTGTPVNDGIELAALHAALPHGGAGADLFSHKAALGHSLGASGLVAVVLNCLAHQTGRIPGNVNTRQPLPTNLGLYCAPVRRPIRRSLACAAGFGGTVAAVSLRSP